MRQSPLLTALLLAAVLLLAATMSRAQALPPNPLPPEAVADKILHDLSGRVALTPAETAAVRPILIEETGKRQALVRSRLAEHPGRAGLLTLRDDLRGLARETDGKLAAVLPPEKMTAVRAYIAERRQELRAQLRTARQGG